MRNAYIKNERKYYESKRHKDFIKRTNEASFHFVQIILPTIHSQTVKYFQVHQKINHKRDTFPIKYSIQLTKRYDWKMKIPCLKTKIACVPSNVTISPQTQLLPNQIHNLIHTFYSLTPKTSPQTKNAQKTRTAVTDQ